MKTFLFEICQKVFKVAVAIDFMAYFLSQKKENSIWK
jgi:hypothetical protein